MTTVFDVDTLYGKGLAYVVLNEGSAIVVSCVLLDQTDEVIFITADHRNAWIVAKAYNED